MRKFNLLGIALSSCLLLAVAAQAQCKTPLETPGAECSGVEGTVVAMNMPDAPTPQPASDATAAPAPTMMVAQRHPATMPEISRSEMQVWRGLVIAQHSAALFDAWSTRNSLSQGHGYERNRLMRPFAGNSSIYGATQVAPTGLDFLSRYLLRSNNGVVRKFWWVPQTAFTAGSVWVGVRNMHVANGR